MKALKELFQSNPVLLLLIVGIAGIYTVVLFHYARQEKVAAKIEKYFIFFILLCSSRMTVAPFNYFNPSGLAARQVKNLDLIQVGVFAVFF
ncbi:hypothetical protein [Argonema galeatum]|uniref:hypothetical protein n=1 Tax=Argonema galeatum TaxID=2942762 RepID=UPI002011F412|nr:hypothetical protein [Argonema galeatum]MCL1467688.1 hypothetical protein [Argonema galeatum A003/A1]